MVVNVSALKNMLNRKLSNTRVRRRLIALDKLTPLLVNKFSSVLQSYIYIKITITTGVETLHSRYNHYGYCF